MYTKVGLLAALLLAPGAAQAQVSGVFLDMPPGYEEFSELNHIAGPAPRERRRARARVTPVTYTAPYVVQSTTPGEIPLPPYLTLHETTEPTPTTRLFEAGVECKTPFQIQQIAAGSSVFSRRERFAFSAVREAAIGHQLETGNCVRFETAELRVVRRGSFTYDGITTRYVVAEAAPSGTEVYVLD